MIYSQWLSKWLIEWVKPAVKPRTYEKYSSIARLQIMPRLGAYELSDITCERLQWLTAELLKRYSVNTVTGITAVLKNSLSCARAANVANADFTADRAVLKLPKKQRSETQCFTYTQQKNLENYIIKSGKPKLTGILLSLYTGLRIGELMALQWSDIDFARAKISVTKTCRDFWSDGKYEKLIGTPKTESSCRIIPVPRQLMPLLRWTKKHTDGIYVISGSGGRNLPIRSYQRTFETILKKIGIPHRGFHSLRHTFATRAIECGMDVKTLADVLGHKSPSLTLSRYAHGFYEHRNAMMNKVGKLFVAGNSPCVDS